MKEVFQLGTKQGREGEATSISTPLIELKKTEIIKLGNNWECVGKKLGLVTPTVKLLVAFAIHVSYRGQRLRS